MLGDFRLSGDAQNLEAIAFFRDFFSKAVMAKHKKISLLIPILMMYGQFLVSSCSSYCAYITHADTSLISSFVRHSTRFRGNRLRSVTAVQSLENLQTGKKLAYNSPGCHAVHSVATPFSPKRPHMHPISFIASLRSANRQGLSMIYEPSLEASSEADPQNAEDPSAAANATSSSRRRTRKPKPPPLDPFTPPPGPDTFPPYAAKDFFRYELIHQSSRSNARVGRIHTPHGVIDTPGFVPVATAAALKAVDVREMDDAAGQQLMFCNTYHLLLQPGPAVVAAAGGLHRFMGRDPTRPLITDSGGFQVAAAAAAAAEKIGPIVQLLPCFAACCCLRRTHRTVVLGEVGGGCGG
jgi:hypothetical protein